MSAYPAQILDDPYTIIPLYGKYGQGLTAKISPQDAARVRRRRWYVTTDGYVYCYEVNQKKRTKITLHRFVKRAADGQLVDHWNRDKLDNRRKNLRVATRQGNARNRSLMSGKKLAYKGITRLPNGRFQAQIVIDGHKSYLGEYDCPIKAAEIYDACARYHFGEFAATNFEGTEEHSVEALKKRKRDTKLARQHSSFLGVGKTSSSGRFVAVVMVDRDIFEVAGFSDEIAAARVRDSLARYYLGTEAVVNFPTGEPMSVDQAKAHVRMLAYKEGRRTSPYLYVFRDKAKGIHPWVARVRFDKGRTDILSGAYATEIEAARAVDRALEASGRPRVNFA